MPSISFEAIRKEALALEQDQLDTREQPVCLAANTTSAPTLDGATDWKQELRVEIMQEVKGQMAELSRTLLDEL